MWDAEDFGWVTNEKNWTRCTNGCCYVWVPLRENLFEPQECSNELYDYDYYGGYYKTPPNFDPYEHEHWCEGDGCAFCQPSSVPVTPEEWLSGH